jgi:carbon monoxide dehydrogenase subunit G
MAMELDHSFTVPVPPDQAWGILLDVERIAPCMPGATVDEVDGDVVNGRIKVKVGPVSLTYKGTAKFTERDSDAHVVVLEAAGKETRGAGTASATVRASMAPDASGSGTDVTMHTSMNVTGRPAQFGRGVMVEVGSKLVEQFAANLAKLIGGDTGSGDTGSGDTGSGDAGSGATAGASSAADGTGAPAATADTSAGNGSGGAAASTTPASAASTTPASAVSAAAASAASTSAPAQEDSLNLVKLVGPALLKRLVPVVAGAAGVALLSRLFWRLRHRAGRAAKG